MNVLYTLTVLAANFDTSGEQPPGVDGISTVIPIAAQANANEPHSWSR